MELIEFDFTEKNLENYNKIFKIIENKDISILVNNVGMNNHLNNFEKSDKKDLENVFTANMLPI